MKPPITIFVATGLTLASAMLHASSDPPAHPLQPSAPRTVTVSESQTPPVIRAGLLQSTLIVLPTEEKVASVFAGDTVDWVFDGGRVASRFISVKQRRQLTMLVERGSLSFHALHEVLGPGSVRVKQFVVQQSDDSPDLDEVRVELSRASSLEYQAICERLRQLDVVREFREDDAI